MRIVLVFLAIFFGLLADGQQPTAVIPIDTSKESREYWNNWAKDLIEVSIEQKKDSLYVKKEVLLAFSDSSLRKMVFPDKYDWPATLELLQHMELKKAFWHLINLYITDSTSRSRVMGIFILYDSVLEMDKVLVNVFYTYAYADPRISKMIEGKPQITRPDLLEKHLAMNKEIINYIWYNRKNKLTPTK